MLFSSKICFTFVKSTKKGQNEPKIHVIQEMKDRIRQIMESQHMTQQVFADFIGIAPATLSGIFTERTKPTINTVEAIKKKLPNLSTDWLMFGKGQMYVDQQADGEPKSGPAASPQAGSSAMETLLDFDQPIPPALHPVQRPMNNMSGVRNTRLEMNFENMNNIDKIQRKVTEIRVFYDDQTWESFVPAKK
jgi:transcriptional regulator with XRE-family HTH domain